MIFEIVHRTAYRYQSTVTQSQHLIHLAPREAKWQDILRHSIIIEPAPSWRSDFTDYFGNPASVIGIEEEHQELVIHARSTIEVQPRPVLPVDRGGPWEDVLARLTRGRSEVDLDALQYALPSAATPTSNAILAYASPSFPPSRPALAAAWDLTCRIYDEFKFDATATDVSTPVERVLALKRGVCQDFAHLALACLRAMRMPARYVSGYLLTRPPPGKEKLQGADASHAWISVWIPDTGWVDLDPTNRAMPSEEHIVFAYGREYGDVSPVSGVLLGGGSHAVEVAVDVDPREGS
ncbi:MAG: transglutaminase family protein [Hyphomicrobiaceae bacterium]|nr:transglutaminase family protein [Hyphomicrobiaceae bacterium]